MFLNFISLMTKCFSLLNVTVKTDVKRKLKKTRENKELLAIFTPPTSPLVHIVLLKEMKYSIEVFQCLIYYYYGYDKTNTGDESNDRKDHDGNATRSTSDASQVKI